MIEIFIAIAAIIDHKTTIDTGICTFRSDKHEIFIQICFLQLCKR